MLRDCVKLHVMMIARELKKKRNKKLFPVGYKTRYLSNLIAFIKLIV